MRLRAAAVAWKLRHVHSDGEFLAHFHDLVSAAHDEGAELVVLPELQILELLALAPDLEEKDVPRFLVQFAQEFEDWIARISSSSDMILVGGSHFREDGEGRIMNVTATAAPGRGVILTPKNKLTKYERECWDLTPGNGLGELPAERVGVTVCYDAEFPEAGRSLAEAGSLVQCVPAFTETRRGFQRVRWSCHARAIENQVFVVHASLVGALGYEPVPASVGSSAIIAPCIEPFPESAVLAETPLDEEGVVLADLDFEALREARASGTVRNWDDRSGDWSVKTRSPGAELPGG